jgi:hypothetical protein
MAATAAKKPTAAVGAAVAEIGRWMAEGESSLTTVVVSRIGSRRFACDRRMRAAGRTSGLLALSNLKQVAGVARPAAQVLS